MTNAKALLFVSYVPVSRPHSTAKVETQKSANHRFSAQLNSGASREERIAASQLLAKYPEPRSACLRNLTPRHFINLTNGVDALQCMRTLLNNENELRFMRLQSSHCESGAYNKILSSLDDELLFSLACGRECYVYDFASRNKVRGVPRSLFLGLQFVKWSLAYLWLGSVSPTLVPSSVMVRGKNIVPFWRDHVMPYVVSKDTKRKLRYYSSFAHEMGVKEISLFGVYGRICETDGCKTIHSKMVRDWLEMSRRSPTNSDDEHHHWMIRNGLAIYDPNSTADELVQIQNSLRNMNMR